MSWQAVQWVLQHSKSKHSARLVLLVLAEHAHDDGSDAYPSVKTIMAEANLCHGTVHEALEKLKGLGEIVSDGQIRSGTVSYWLPGVQNLDGGPESGRGDGEGVQDAEEGVQNSGIGVQDLESEPQNLDGGRPSSGHEPSLNPPPDPPEEKSKEPRSDFEFPTEEEIEAQTVEELRELAASNGHYSHIAASQLEHAAKGNEGEPT